MRRASEMLAGVTGARHAAREDAQHHALEEAKRQRWYAFGEMWLRIGAAKQNGYGPEQG